MDTERNKISEYNCILFCKRKLLISFHNWHDWQGNLLQSKKNHNFPPKKYTEVISCLILIKMYGNKLKAIMYVVFCSYFQFFFWRSMVSNIHDFNTNLNLHKYYHCIVATISINNPDLNPTAKKVKVTPRYWQ